MNTYIKTLNPDVIKLVGVNGALLFQHISYWMESTSLDCIYRSATNLISDLGDSLTKNQLYYARKKLIETGLITVSTEHSDKWNRTTFYRITSKGQSLRILTKKYIRKTKEQVDTSIPDSLNVDSSDVKDGVVQTHQDGGKQAIAKRESVKNTYTVNQSEFERREVLLKQKMLPKHLYAEHMKQKRLDEQQNKEPFIPKSMIKSWEEGTTGNHNATKGIPEHLLNNPVIAKMLKMKGKYTKKQCVSQSDDVTTMKGMSEEHGVGNRKQQENTPSLSGLMKGCFDSGVTDDQEKLYSMKINQQHFVEDY